MRTVDNTATSDEVSPQPTIPVVDEDQQRQSPAPAYEIADATDAAGLVHGPRDAHSQAEQDVATEIQPHPDDVAADKARAVVEELERQRLADEEAERLRVSEEEA